VIRVKNKKNWKGSGEYIGRPSALGNPWSHKDDTIAKYKVESRAESISRYRDFLFKVVREKSDEYPDIIAELNRLANIAIKGDLNLVCWCCPDDCHGDVIKEVLEMRLFDPCLEGKTHINTYTKSKLKLGRDLSNLAEIPVRIEGFNYPSLENYWYWVATGEQHEELKTLPPFEAKGKGKKLDRVFDPFFESKIKTAMRLKIEQHPILKRTLAQTTQIITHYYTYDEKVKMLPKFEWISEHWENIRKDLRA